MASLIRIVYRASLMRGETTTSADLASCRPAEVSLWRKPTFVDSEARSGVARTNEAADAAHRVRGAPYMHFRSPSQSRFVERFNGKLRDEFLSRAWFRSYADVFVERWRPFATNVDPIAHTAITLLLRSVELDWISRISTRGTRPD
ncbi:integrase core domain-containing protein [Burkholderia ambifaria]|nr:integrase core domain-containing protein [Burkholderia ambifaria]